jgi:integrase/recombinase XerC
MATLYLRSNGYYYLLSVVNGRRIWKSTGCKRKSEAIQYVSESRQKQREKPPIDLSQFTTQLLTYLESNLAASTVKLYKGAFKKFISLMGNLNVGEITPQHVEEYKLLRAKEVSPVKVNIDFRNLRAALNVAINWKVIEENPFKKCKQLRIPPQKPTYLTHEEFNKIRGIIDQKWYEEIIVFAVSTMMRLGEIVNLQWTSVDLERREITVENTDEFRVKTHKPRTIPMNEWVFYMLSNKPIKAGRVFTFPDGRALPKGYVSHKFKKYVIKAELSKKIHFHTLRHTGATWLVQNDIPIYSVQQILGHSNISITQIYSHLEVDHLRKPMERLDQYFKLKLD